MDLRDQLKEIQKTAKAKRYITCALCNKTVLKKDMGKHFLSEHKD